MGRIVAQTEHVKVERVADYNEYRVAYKGVIRDRQEAMAYYTDDFDDAEGTMHCMEQSYILDVHECDKVPVR